MSNYTVRRDDGKFWVSPGRWSDDYREAQKFRNWKNAAQEGIDSQDIGRGPNCIIADYGTHTERVVLSIQQPSLFGEKTHD